MDGVDVIGTFKEEVGGNNQIIDAQKARRAAAGKKRVRSL
jgi:hypothetical protein